jgi:hypothetical protein
MPDVNRIQITQDELVASFGDYYLDAGQNEENLHALPFEEFGTATAGTQLQTDQTVIREATVEFDEILQPYQTEFTSKGGMKFLPVEIFLHRMKVDIKLDPNELKGKWLTFLTANGVDPLEWPLIRWTIEKYLMPKAQEDLEMKAIYRGQRVNPEEGVAGMAIETMDGIERHLAILEAAEKLDYIVTGAIPGSAADFVTQVENFVKAIPENLRYNVAMEINMSRTNRDIFREGMQAKYNINYAQTDTLTKLRLYENFTVVGRASMMGKNRFWTTPKANLLIPTKGFTNVRAFDLQKFDRYVKFLSDWYVGAGFIEPKLIFASNQA